MAKQQFQTPRGTADILPGEQVRWRYFEARASEAAARFGYERIDTPTFEDARLYVRGVGEFTDVVEKETYTFEDRGGDRITLRPEGTAGVCRAYLQHGMGNLPQPVRLFYFNSLFRYERPQAGRFREHHQLGIEVIGDADAAIDAEVIELAWRLLEDLDIGGLTLLVNSIGDPECRPAYVGMLKDYYSGAVDELCHNCRRRLERNPLRLLDCKEDQCQPSIAAGLRASGVAALLAPSGRSLRGQLRYAASVNATHAAILGADELARGSVTLRDLSRSDQRDVPMDKLADALTATN